MGFQDIKKKHTKEHTVGNPEKKNKSQEKPQKQPRKPPKNIGNPEKPRGNPGKKPDRDTSPGDLLFNFPRRLLRTTGVNLKSQRFFLERCGRRPAVSSTVSIWRRAHLGVQPVTRPRKVKPPENNTFQGMT